MARQPIAHQARSRSRHIVLLLLARSGCEPVLLGMPRLWPASPAHVPASPLSVGLRPYRRRLWRQRAMIILARFLALATLCLIAANLLALLAASGLPGIVRWGPAVLLLLAGVWLTAVHRPSLGETALLLDRHFRLREALGTALEYEPTGERGALAQQQVAIALYSLRGLPPHPWRARHSVPWFLTAVLLAIAGLSSLVVARGGADNVSTVAAGQRMRRAVDGGSLAQIAPNNSPLTSQSPLVLPLQQTRPGASRQPAVTRQPILATSLQIRQGPQLSAGTGPIGDAPGLLANNLAGGSVAGNRSTGNGPSGTARRYGTTGSSGQPGQAGAGQSQGGQGGAPGNSSGAGNGQGNQQPASGPQNSLGQSSSGTVAGQNPSASSQGQSRQNGGQPSSGTQNSSGVNPFGQDPGAPRANSGANQNNGSHARAGQSRPGGKPAPSGSTSSRQGGAQANNGGNSSNGPDYLAQRNRHGATNTKLSNQSGASQGKAGPALGAKITLGGRPIVSNGSQGPELVRVVPFSAASGPGLNGPSGGSATVEGYVPEENMTLSPDEQALIRAYFSNGSGP